MKEAQDVAEGRICCCGPDAEVVLVITRGLLEDYGARLSSLSKRLENSKPME